MGNPSDQKGAYSHPFLHWLLVVLGTFLVSLVFSLVGALLLFSGWVTFQGKASWWDLAVGLPLILLGASIILINVYQILASILDRRYSKNHCPLCQKT